MKIELEMNFHYFIDIIWQIIQRIDAQVARKYTAEALPIRRKRRN